ncbi:hypothetical protein F2Q70_00002759 [Brassica cretica]|uniref:Uncharacterized protein n=1 Tax=Brassica cretica TaxID=69181 RepID=A0A8S9IZ09_BRACR|nr:hypothetical protein F2Q70_00002759 [Brassica cretica]
MVAPLILVRDNNGDLHDQGAAIPEPDATTTVVKEEKLQGGDFEVESLMSFGWSHWCRSTPTTEHRSTYTNQNRSTEVPEHRSTTPTESTASCNAVKTLTHEEFAAKHPHPPSPDNVRIDRHTNNNVDRHTEASIDRYPSPHIDRRAPITYRVLMPKIDVARLNAVMPKPKPSEQPPEPIRTPSDDGDDPMEEDRVSTGRTIRRRKEKVAKHLKRGANEKEKENFQNRVFRIPLHKPFEEAYYSHRLWMFQNTHIRPALTMSESIDIPTATSIDTQKLISIDTHHLLSIDEPLSPTVVQMPKIDVARLNALRRKLKPSEQPPKPIRTPSDDGDYPMEEDRVSTGRTLRRRKEKVAKHLKRGANEKEKENFQKRVFRIPLHKPFEEAYYSHRFWADEHHHESFAVETVTYTPGADKLQDSFTDEELLNMQKRDNTDQFKAEAAWERTRFSQSIDTLHQQSIDKCPQQSIDINNTTSIDNHSIPKTTVSEKDKLDNQKFYWEEKDEYGVYKDDREFSRDLDGHTIPVHNKDIRRLLERASRDEPAYICLPEHASQFTQTKLAPEIYTKDEINEMFYGVCSELDRNKEVFQMKLDGVYYPLNDSISWLTTCMEEMKQDIARIQNATDTVRPQSIDIRQSPLLDIHHHASIDNRLATSIDTNPPCPHTIKSQPDFHTREEIDQLVEGIYRTLETTEERLDGRCDDIYFPMNLTISALTSKVEAIKGELVEIHSYIARRPEASISIDRRIKKSIDTNHSASIDIDTNRGKLVPKTTSDMSNPSYHGKEISADTYAALTRNQFNLESLGHKKKKEDISTDTNMSTSIDISSPASTDNNVLESVDIYSGLDVGQKEVDMTWWQPPLRLDSWKHVQS